MRRIPYIILVLAVLYGCNPRLTSPQLATQQEFIFGQEFASDSLRLDAKWWQMFGDSTLDTLVERAIKQNRDIEIAASRIAEAQHNLVATRGEFWPSLEFERSGEGKYTGASDKIAQNYNLLISSSWEIPLFGSLRHATEQAKATIDYEVWQYYGVRLALAAEVATTYFTLVQYREDLRIAQRSSTLRSEMVQLIDSLYAYGFASGVHLEQAKSLLYTAQADIRRYERAVAQTTLSLATLTGDTAEEFMTLKLGEADRRYRAYEVAIGVPSDILHRRPDVMSAYYTMQQSGAAVGIARSARLPSITLDLYGGMSTGKVAHLVSKRGWVADVLLSMTQPIYRFGVLRRREKAAREAYRQSLLAYEKSYIAALNDVESALAAITTTREELTRYAGLVKSYRNIAIKTYALYRNGLSDYLDVIDAERSLYNTQMQLENLAAQQQINYVGLCKALGGGF